MINKSKEILKQKEITYREVAFILNITERQAMNILNKKNKALYNYLILSFISGVSINEMFELTEEEKKHILKRVEALTSTLNHT
jgi:transcriptional regulator with XRE-family HTH domain